MPIRPTIVGLRGRRAIAAAVEGLVAADVAALVAAKEDGRPLPPLYLSGVRYRPEVRREDWRTAPVVLRQGFGDCEDLAAWRAAELRLSGDRRAHVILKRTGRRVLHALVKRGDGQVEDPSRVLRDGPSVRRLPDGGADVDIPGGPVVRGRGPEGAVRALRRGAEEAEGAGRRTWADRLKLAAHTVATGRAPWPGPTWDALAAWGGR